MKDGVSARIPDKTRSGDTIGSTTFEESSLSTLPPRWWSASFSYFVATASASSVHVQAYPKASTIQFVFRLPITERFVVRFLILVTFGHCEKYMSLIIFTAALLAVARIVEQFEVELDFAAYRPVGAVALRSSRYRSVD